MKEEIKELWAVTCIVFYAGFIATIFTFTCVMLLWGLFKMVGVSFEEPVQKVEVIIK